MYLDSAEQIIIVFVGIWALVAIVGIIYMLLAKPSDKKETPTIKYSSSEMTVEHHESVGIKPVEEKIETREMKVEALYNYEVDSSIWVCPECDTENSSDRVVCTVCGARRR